MLREFAPRQQPGDTVHNEINNGTFNESVIQAGRSQVTYNYQSPPPGKD